MYKVKMIREEEDMPKQKKSEAMLRDLLEVIPTLAKHGLEGEVQTKVRKLRNGRRQKHYTLELSRKFITYNIDDMGNKKVEHNLKVSAPITKETNKVAVMADLKAKIIADIKRLRKEQKPYVDTFSFREGIKVKKLAEVYLEHNAFLNVQNKRIRNNMVKGKAPTTGDNYLGVEIEFASKMDRDHICDLLFEAGLGRNITVKRDGSIKVDEDFPHQIEINVLVRESEYASVITKLCKVLNEQVGVRVDKSCGLHVHVDMRNRDVKKCFANLAVMQHFFYEMNPAARKTSTYSVPVDKKEFPGIPGHYSGVNSDSYAKYKTIEMRMHCGTTQAKKINNWIAFILAVVNHGNKIAETPKSVAKAKELLGLSDELALYIEQRVAKFAAQHKKIKSSTWMDKVEPVTATPDATLVDEQSEVA